MAQEIEKKYLVLADKLPPLAGGVLYTQGYLCLAPLIRFRVFGNKVCLNLKKIIKNNPIREEWEFYNELNSEEIKKLIQLSLKKPIEKIRHEIEHEGLTWEIDVYQGENKGLITAEVELSTENSIPLFPEWIDSKHEISNDEKYFNRNLGERPYKFFEEEARKDSPKTAEVVS